MSLFTTAEVTCAACGNKHEVLRAASINAAAAFTIPSGHELKFHITVTTSTGANFRFEENNANNRDSGGSFMQLSNAIAGTFAARVGFVKVSSVGFPEMIYRVVDQHDVELLFADAAELRFDRGLLAGQPLVAQQIEAQQRGARRRQKKYQR